MAWRLDRDGAAKVTQRASGPRATVTALARSSPTGKLSVELVGLFVATGPMNRKPALVCSVTVRLPVTAMAPAGTPPTSKVRATWLAEETREAAGADAGVEEAGRDERDEEWHRSRA